MKIEKVTLKRWSEIHKFAKSGWLFRGQRDAEWELETSLERFCSNHRVPPRKRSALESRLLREFRRTYHLYAGHVPEKDSVPEWMSIMQHHGAPTRLLDFTYSIYVAAYFATESAATQSAVWAINGPWVLRRAAQLLRAAGKSGTELSRM